MQGARWAALALALAACAAEPVRWDKPGVDDYQRSRDLATCASLARNEMRSHRALAREEGLGSDSAAIGRSDDAAVTRRLREVDAEERRAKLIGDCMRAKGYSPAAEAADPGA